MKSYFVYILSNKKYGALYIGVTNELLRRVYEHKKKIFKGFTGRYDINKLVYVEETNDIYAALEREKQLKNWKREWKIELIHKMNPEWNDLFYEYGGTDDIFDEYYKILDDKGKSDYKSLDSGSSPE